MKQLISIFVFLFCLSEIIAQETSPVTDNPFNYLELTGEFDLIVDFAMVNPECATKQENYYSILIGTTVIEDKIERISILIPCLGNEFVQGDLVTIKPLKTPKKNIVYTIRNYKKDGQEFSDVLGAEFRATWGEVVKVL